MLERQWQHFVSLFLLYNIKTCSEHEPMKLLSKQIREGKTLESSPLDHHHRLLCAAPILSSFFSHPPPHCYCFSLPSIPPSHPPPSVSSLYSPLFLIHPETEPHARTHTHTYCCAYSTSCANGSVLALVMCV